MQMSPVFRLIELFAVVAIIVLLTSILLSALDQARQTARNTVFLTNLRRMEIAHWMYMTEHNGWFVQVGLAHSGTLADEKRAWINTLELYCSDKLLARSSLPPMTAHGTTPFGFLELPKRPSVILLLQLAV